MAHDHEKEHSHGHGEGEDRKKQLFRLIFSAVFFFVLLILEHVVKLPAMKDRLTNTFLYMIPYLIVGSGIIREAVEGIWHGEVLDENFLMLIASLGAFAVGENAEAAAVFLFYSVGELFEDYAVDRSHDQIKALLDIAPQSANLIKKDGSLETVTPDRLSAGNEIMLLPGERVPVDGRVLEGTSMIDTAAITGEPVPVKVSAGDPVISGCVNGSGTLKLLVEKEYDDSTVARVLKLTEEATDRKSKTENFITSFARVYTPVVVGAAVLLAVLPPLLFGEPFGEWLKRACSFLVISCPCALVVSVPLSFFAGLGAASKNGILIKGSNYLEVLSKAEIFASDKTGTLTKGEFSIREILPAEGVLEEELMQAAFTAESLSDHPIAVSILSRSDGTHRKADQAENITGKGIIARCEGKKILAGNKALLMSEGIAVPETENAGTVVHVAEDGRYLGTIIISDPVKEESAAAIRELLSLGVRETVLLTGDRLPAAEAIQKTLGIDRVYAGLLPQDKVEKVEELEKTLTKGTLLYAGDGINDAPVIRRADAGISMGCMGSDAAIEAADVVIMDDDIRKIPEAVRISAASMRIAKQNIVFALLVKAVFLVLGALGISNMWLAVFADVGVAMLCILNSMRMLAWPRKENK